jgi:hypothetical protein
MRVHTGYGDQPVDPLIAQAEGIDRCPAFRNTAYVVFEDLELADFGNRIPLLTFEVIADSDGCSMTRIITTLLPETLNAAMDTTLSGFSVDQGTCVDILATLSDAIPSPAWRMTACWTSGWPKRSRIRPPRCFPNRRRRAMAAPTIPMATDGRIAANRCRRCASAACAITIPRAITSQACNAASGAARRARWR